MKNVVKKIIVYSMVGLFQAGLFATVAEAAAKTNNLPPGYDQRQDQKKNSDKKKVEAPKKKVEPSKKKVEPPKKKVEPPKKKIEPPKKKVEPPKKKVEPPKKKDNNKNQRDIDRKIEAEKQRQKR